MRRTLFLSLLVPTLLGSALAASPAVTSVTVNATVDDICEITSPTSIDFAYQAANPEAAEGTALVQLRCNQDTAPFIGYWDDTAFHRVVPDFVIQGGDPTGTGSGGPAWKVVEAPKSTEKYPAGTLAMAKTATDAPGTTQSQFFIMTGDNGLPPEYAVAGKVIKGMDAADAIEALGQGDGPPSRAATIIKATFTAK